MFDVVTVGGATRDIFFKSEKFTIAGDKSHDKDLFLPYGSKIVADDVYYTYGGGAVNVSVSLSRLGLKTAALFAVGEEGTGSMIIKTLKQNRVNTTMSKRVASSHTGLSIFLVGRDGDHAAVLERGANDFLDIKDIKKIKKTRWLYITSLTGKSEKILPRLFELAKKNNVRVAFNPGSKQLAQGYSFLKDFLENTDVLALNRSEAEALVFSKKRKKNLTLDETLIEIGKMGPNVVVVTSGAEGSSVIFEGAIRHQKAHLTKAVDTTGAGDSFGSAFLYGIINGFDLSYCLKIASVNSASVVTKMGAIDGLLGYNKIKNSPWL